MVQLFSSLQKTGTAPVATVTDAELKSFAKIDGTGDDTLITLLNKASTDYIEDLMNKSFVNQSYKLYLDCFPSELDDNILKPYIEIQNTPLVSVASIAYIDTDGNSQTLASTEYEVDTFADGPGRIIEAYDKTWPDTRATSNAVIVTYTAGYGAAAAVPEGYKTIIKLYFTHLYENREGYTTDSIKEVPMLLNALINQYRVKRFL